jgi:hypothetical protein
MYMSLINKLIVFILTIKTINLFDVEKNMLVFYKQYCTIYYKKTKIIISYKIINYY